jgi:hypothetical protein
MAIEWDNGFIKRIEVGGLTGAAWGITVRDRRSWFTLGDGPGCVAFDLGCIALTNGFRRQIELAMAEGRWLLTHDITSWRGNVSIRHCLESLVPSRLSAVGIDVRFDRPSFDRAFVGTSVVTDRMRERWIHGTAPRVALMGPKGFVAIQVTTRTTWLQQVVDVRVEPETWIVETALEGEIGGASRRESDTGAVGLVGPRMGVIPAGTVIELGLDCELLAMENHVQREDMLQPA